MDITMTTESVPEMDPAGVRLQRLMTWLSPAFPVGAFSYSHGLEAAVETGMVTDRAMLAVWVETIVTTGAGRIDAALFRAAHEALTENDMDALGWAVERGDVLRPTRELGLETASQGTAFIGAVDRHWPAAALTDLIALAEREDREIAYPVAVGAAAATHDIAVAPALEGYLHAFAANIVSAGVRAIPLGQSDGLHVLAALEPIIVAAAARVCPIEDLGSAAIMVDWASAIHETQYTRLFRS